MTARPSSYDDEGRAERIRLNLILFREKQWNISQEAVATRAGISVDNLRRYEQGRKVDAVVLSKLAAALGHKVDDFLEENPPPPDPALVPAFLFSTTTGIEVDEDLVQKVRQSISDATKEHVRRLRERKGVSAPKKPVKPKG